VPDGQVSEVQHEKPAKCGSIVLDEAWRLRQVEAALGRGHWRRMGYSLRTSRQLKSRFP
jgi:hypothetical protein